MKIRYCVGWDVKSDKPIYEIGRFQSWTWNMHNVLYAMCIDKNGRPFRSDEKSIEFLQPWYKRIFKK